MSGPAAPQAAGVAPCGLHEPRVPLRPCLSPPESEALGPDLEFSIFDKFQGSFLVIYPGIWKPLAPGVTFWAPGLCPACIFYPLLMAPACPLSGAYASTLPDDFWEGGDTPRVIPL